MSTQLDNPIQWILGTILILSALSILLVKKPVHSCLSFMLTLSTLATLYLQLAAEFIAVMQIWVYAGAILVIFMFVIVLFQDAHEQISKKQAKSYPLFLFFAAFVFLADLVILGDWLYGITPSPEELPKDFGTIQHLGEELYINFFFPFEVVTLLFLVAVIGALYLGRKSPTACEKETKVLLKEHIVNRPEVNPDKAPTSAGRR